MKKTKKTRPGQKNLENVSSTLPRAPMCLSGQAAKLRRGDLLSWLGQSRPTAGKAYIGSSGQNTVLWWQGDPIDLLWSKKCDVTDRGVQLTSFGPKNVTSLTGGSNWPPLVQKRDRYQQGGPTDLLWSKKRDRYQQGVQLTSFGPKNVTVTNRGVQLTF